MIQPRSNLLIVDKTSGVIGLCIKVLRNKTFAFMGDIFLLSIRLRDIKKARLLKLRLQKKFSPGAIHRALLLRSRFNFLRLPGLYIRFLDNSCVLVNRKVVPISNRIYGPVLKEFCTLWPSVGCVSKDIF